LRAPRVVPELQLEFALELSRPMELVLPHSQEVTIVNKFALLTLAAAALFATSGGASAQIFYSGPGYGPHLEPRYERAYDERRDDERRYRRGYDRRSVGNGCPRNYTVQDGVCKPYRGY
jgi:hypothetical protein